MVPIDALIISRVSGIITIIKMIKEMECIALTIPAIPEKYDLRKDVLPIVFYVIQKRPLVSQR